MNVSEDVNLLVKSKKHPMTQPRLHVCWKLAGSGLLLIPDAITNDQRQLRVPAPCKEFKKPNICPERNIVGFSPLILS